MNDTQRTASHVVARELLHTEMVRLGLTIQSEFVPFSQSRSKDDKETGPGGAIYNRPRYSLNWKIRLYHRRNGAGGRTFDDLVIETDYSAGSAHCPAYKDKAFGVENSVLRATAIRLECEGGFKARVRAGDIGATRDAIEPDSVDVLGCLLIDSEVLDAGTFEEWASNYGYNSDSRKAEAIYRSALETALKLRAALGDETLTKLRELAGQL